MRNFGRFVLHANDYYALQRRILIQRVSHRIQRQRNWRRDVNSFFESWRRVRPRRFTLVRSYRQVERTHNASLLYCCFRKWRHFALNRWSQRALLRDVRKRRAHVSSRIFLTEWGACYAIRREILRHFWRRMQPRGLAIRRAERQVTSSRMTNTIQSCLEKWRSFLIIMQQAISSRITIRIQSNVGIWTSIRTIMRVIVSKWRAYSRILRKLRELLQYRIHETTLIFLTDLVVRRRTLRRCWRCMRPHKMAILHAERKVTCSRITIAIQATFEKWRSLRTIMFIKSCISFQVRFFRIGKSWNTARHILSK